VVVDQKLSGMGLRLPYKLWQTDCAETWVSEHKGHIHLNPHERTLRIFAHRSVEHLLLHELGHIFVHSYLPRKVKTDEKFVALFGGIMKHYRRRLGRVKSSPDFISNYAQVHPEDNFCEVFAIYCRFEGKIRKIHKWLRKHRKSQKVKKQVCWLHAYLKLLQRQKKYSN